MAKFSSGLNSVIAVLCIVLVALLVHIFYPKREEFDDPIGGYVNCSKKSGYQGGWVALPAISPFIAATTKNKPYMRTHERKNRFFKIKKGEIIELDDTMLSNKFRYPNNQRFTVFRDGGKYQNLEHEECKRYRNRMKITKPISGQFFNTKKGKWEDCEEGTFATSEMVKEGNLECLPCPKSVPQGTRHNFRLLGCTETKIPGSPITTAPPTPPTPPPTRAPPTPPPTRAPPTPPPTRAPPTPPPTNTKAQDPMDSNSGWDNDSCELYISILGKDGQDLVCKNNGQEEYVPDCVYKEACQ